LLKRIFSNPGPKTATLLLVIAGWLLITAKQGGLQTVTVPVKFHNLSDKLVLKSNTPEDVEVQLKVLSSLIAPSKKLEISADLDLSRVREGTNSLTLDSSAFQLPLGVSVLRVTPATVKVVAERKGRKNLPVLLRTVGRLPKELHHKTILIEPSTVPVEGPESELARLKSIETEEVEMETVTQNKEVKLVQPSPQVQLLKNEPARIKIVTRPR
jgi:diadenylate cyclase